MLDQSPNDLFVFEEYERLFNLKPTGVVDSLGGKVRVAFVPVGEAEIELLQPINQNIPSLIEYLRTHGTGIYHVFLTTDDIEADASRLAKE
jgi:4-hydroxyphenylpyruvate dioxygenase-like putative hemolysin